MIHCPVEGRKTANFGPADPVVVTRHGDIEQIRRAEVGDPLRVGDRVVDDPLAGARAKDRGFSSADPVIVARYGDIEQIQAPEVDHPLSLIDRIEDDPLPRRGAEDGLFGPADPVVVARHGDVEEVACAVGTAARPPVLFRIVHIAFDGRKTPIWVNPTPS